MQSHWHFHAQVEARGLLIHRRPSSDVLDGQTHAFEKGDIRVGPPQLADLSGALLFAVRLVQSHKLPETCADMPAASHSFRAT